MYGCGTYPRASTISTMTRSKAVQVRLTENNLRVIRQLQEKLGIETRAGLIKHAIACLAHDHNIKPGKAK
jgi:hypothetical protein